MFLQHLINGLSIGSIYALIAMGYNMVYGILELLNFAHGDVYAVGCFAALGLLTMGVHPALALLAGIIVGFVINLFVEKFAYRPVRYSGRVTPTITAVGIAYIIGSIEIWGPEPSLSIGAAKQLQIAGINALRSTPSLAACMVGPLY